MPPAEDLKNRLRADLRVALKARQQDVVAILRSLIAEIDNAESVPVGDAHGTYASRPFGDPGVEAPRRALTVPDLNDILRREIAALEAAALDLERHGEAVRAAALREGAQRASAYLQEG